MSKRVSRQDIDDTLDLIAASYIPGIGFNYREVVDRLREDGKNVVGIFARLYDMDEHCWGALVVMQVEAAQGRLNKRQLNKLLSMMEDMARWDSDYYTQTVNMVMGARRNLETLFEFFEKKLEAPLHDHSLGIGVLNTWTWLAFYCVNHILAMRKHYLDFKFSSNLVGLLEMATNSLGSAGRKWDEATLSRMRERMR